MTLVLPNQCPPAASFTTSGVYYRLGEGTLQPGDSPGPTSWLKPCETRSGKYYKQFEACDAYGLSMFASLSDLNHARDLNPLMARKSVAEFRIEQDQGRVVHSPSADGESHHDWWSSPLEFSPSAIIIESKRELL